MPKRCAKCQMDKPVTEFYKRAQLADGLSSYCKSCWKTLNEERKRELYDQQADYRQKNQSKRRKLNSEYWNEHREEILKKRREKYQADKKKKRKPIRKNKKKTASSKS